MIIGEHPCSFLYGRSGVELQGFWGQGSARLWTILSSRETHLQNIVGIRKNYLALHSLKYIYLLSAGDWEIKKMMGFLLFSVKMQGQYFKSSQPNCKLHKS